MEAGAWLAESLFLAAEHNVENPFWRKSVVAGRTRIIDLKKNVKGLYLVVSPYSKNMVLVIPRGFNGAGWLALARALHSVIGNGEVSGSASSLLPDPLRDPTIPSKAPPLKT